MVNVYVPPPEDTAPKTAAEADAQNVVGRQNRENVGLSGYGGRSTEQLNAINQQTQQDQKQQAQQQNQQDQQQQERAIAAGRAADMMRTMGYNVATGQDTYDAVMGYVPVTQSPTFLDNLSSRPGYYDPKTIGDTTTQQLRFMTDTQRMMFSQMGIEIASSDVMMGTILEGQRKSAALTPGTRDDQFFLNELSKWNRTGVETSSEYHVETKATGVQQKANPYENWGDVALAFEKGGNLKDFTVDKYGFNPNVGGMLGYTKPMKYQGWEDDVALGQQQTRQVGGLLPGGQGLQETAWTMAKTGQAATVDFQPAIDYLDYQKGRYGPYGALYGGIPDTTPNMPPGAGTPGTGAGTALSVVLGGGVPLSKDWNPFVVSAAEPIGYIAEGIQLGWTGKPQTESGTYIESARGDIFGFQIPIISNVLAFFQPESIKTISQKKMPESSITEYSRIPETQVISKIPLPDQVITIIDPTTGETITTTIKGVQTDTTTFGGVMANTTISGGVQTDVIITPGLSGYDKLNQSVRDFLRLPKPEEGEAAMRVAGLFNPFTIVPTVAAITAETISPERAGDARAMESLVGFRGQYTQFYEQPLLVPASYAAGALFGTAAKGVEGLYGASRASAAELIISRGQTARAAEMYGGFVMEKAPLVLAGMYGVSIAARSTEGFTSFVPEEVIPKARSLVMQEAVPMGYGFSAPSQIVKTVQISDIGFKAAVQEGATTGRFDYYVKQPVTRPYEMAKIDYAAFKQEGGVGAIDYLFSKTKTVTPEVSRDYMPYEGIEKTAYLKPAERPARPIPQEVNRNYYSYEGIENVAYPKVEPKVQAETQRNYYDYAGIERDAYPINSVILSAKAMWQEWRTPERLLYFSSYGGLNFLSQGLPPENWGATIGARGTGLPIQRGDAGVGGRITTKTVGGVEVTGLRPEQSMFKMGLEDKPVISSGEIRPKIGGQRLDYRNEPRGPMKPMDSSQIKQSAIQIERGEMPAQRMPVPERISQPLSFGFNLLQVQQPGGEQRSAVEVLPAFMTGQISGLTQSQSVRQTQQSSQVTEAARSRQFDQVMRQMQRDDQIVTRRSRQGSDVTSSFKSAQAIDQSIKQTSDMARTTAQRTDQRITTDFKPWQDTWSERITIPPPPIIPLLPLFPGGGGGYGKKRRGRKFTEYFPMGILAGVQAGYNLKIPRMARPKKGRLVPKTMLSPVKRKKK